MWKFNAAVSTFSFALFVILLTINVRKVDGKPPSRITGGQDAGDEFSHVVSLGRNDNYDTHFCGGAIISPRHVATAGHCVFGDTLEIVVRSGARNVRDGQPRVSKVDRIFVHPNYTLQTYYHPVQNDIAVLELYEYLNLDDGKTSQILLPTARPEVKKVGQVAGWGALSNEATTQHFVLQKASMRLLDNQECWFRGAVFERPLKLCGYQPKATICAGDSGSPLSLNNEIIGVASASGCKIGDAHIYTSVYEYRDWIKSIISQT